MDDAWRSALRTLRPSKIHQSLRPPVGDSDRGAARSAGEAPGQAAVGPIAVEPVGTQPDQVVRVHGIGRIQVPLLSEAVERGSVPRVTPAQRVVAAISAR